MPKKVFEGQVISDKMDKTVVVTVGMVKSHPLYDKVMNINKKFKAHDELGAKEGDTVIIEESKPFSKEVTWVVKEITEEAE